MAELQITPGKGRRKHIHTPRVDLTPMVDLGFLLITFFMYTTTMAKPKVMDLSVPDKSKPAIQDVVIPAESRLVLIPTSRHEIAWMKGIQDPAKGYQFCHYSGSNNLRELLIAEQARTKALGPEFSKEAHQLHVLIKPDTGASFQDIVHCLDEMTINAVYYSTMMPLSPPEKEQVKKSLDSVYGKSMAL